MRLGGGERLGGAEPQRDGIEIAPGVRLSWRTLALAVPACLVVIAAIAGFGSVEITEYGLHENLLSRRVDSSPYASGRYWIGPWSRFIRFPAVVKTIQFSDSKMMGDLALDEVGDPMLRSRTRDGLDVKIELSFQYQLEAQSVYKLYTTLGPGPEFHRTYVRLAIDRLTEIATEYTANEFFTDRTRIGKSMEQRLQEDFRRHLYASIFSFQLRSVGLPDDFEKSIQLTEVKKQDVHVAEAEQRSTRVALETQLLQAERRVQVRQNKADGYARSVMLANAADIQQFKVTQEKAADSYSGVLKALDSNEAELLAYVQARVLRDHSGDKTTVGLSLPGVGFSPVAAASAAAAS
eukprot:TRINITY_DN57464_c0_g1_i1.p1 TRINITY_DN57464_c0_g1~~TRINITY_DN57464_c0_g1_i1.p1  ORF type:complete len:350 (+),score=73.23 TRINITY_DN57464_c0_g1_i1:126-1175(+)